MRFRKDYLTTGITIIDLASTLHTRFPDQPATERQELLKLLVDKASWAENRLTVEFHEPWKTLQNTATTANAGLLAFTREWPARGDSNSRPSA